MIEIRSEEKPGFYSVVVDTLPVVQRAYVSIETEDGPINSFDPRYSVHEWMKGQILSYSFSDNKRECDLELQWKQVEKGDGLVLAVRITNRTQGTLRLKSISPLVATRDTGGFFSFCESTKDTVVLNDEWERCYGQAETVGLNSQVEFRSAWDVHIVDRKRNQIFTASYYEVPNAKLAYKIRRVDDSESMDFEIYADTRAGKRGVIVPAGDTFVLSEIIILFTEGSPLQMLEHYGRLIAERNNVKPTKKIQVGWADWYFAYGTTTEEEALKNLEFIARELKDFGVDYFEIDSAWQLGVETSPPPDNNCAGGPWVPNSKFPHGMKWFADRIREKGLKPGIWVRPFQMIENADERKQHPEWFNSKGQMDYSNPEVLAWVKNLFRVLANDWGYEYIKYDFVAFDHYGEWGPKLFDEYANHPEPIDQSRTNIQAYRDALKVIRETTAGKALLMACNSLMAPTLGLADAYRIGDDVGDWPRTFKYGVKSVSPRYFTNGVYWANDPDCVLVREPFTLDQARMWVSLVALSGGVVFISEKVYALPHERLEIIKKILPVYGNPQEPYGFGRPVDLFERGTAEIWHLKIQKDFGSWDILGVFNWSDAVVEKRIDLPLVDFLPDSSYLVHDFWEDTFLGELKSSITATLRPHSCRVFVLRPSLPVPSLVSTTRHITQGGVEIKNLDWDQTSATLSGICQVIKNNPYTVSIHLPSGFRPAEIVGAERITSLREDILRLRLSSTKTGEKSCRVKFLNNNFQ